jgi:hypothetical protein
VDWITLTIEIVGIGIFILWCVIPIREFAQIHRTIRARNAAEHAKHAGNKGAK